MSHKGDRIKARARDFGWETQNPLMPIFAMGKTKGSLPCSKSFCEVDKSNVVLLTLKVAEDKDGIIIRLMETEGIDTTVTVTLPFVNIREAYLTNLVEEDRKILDCQQNAVTVPIKAFGISTIRMKI